jgi:hypothetical protein
MVPNLGALGARNAFWLFAAFLFIVDFLSDLCTASGKTKVVG